MGERRVCLWQVGKGKEYDCDDDMIWCIVSVDENDRVACIGP